MSSSKKQEKIKILRQIFPDAHIRKDVEFVCFCPKHSHHKQKLEINLDTDKFNCWVCKYSGSVFKVLSEYGNKKQRSAYLALVDRGQIKEDEGAFSKIELPKEYKFLLDFKRTEGAEAYRWMQSLGVDDNTLLQNKVGFCLEGKYRGRLVWPSYDCAGNLNYFVARSYWKNSNLKTIKCDRSLNEIVWNDMFVDWSLPIVLVEGGKAYLKHFRKIQNMVCLCGSSVGSNSLLFEKIIVNSNKVTIALDADAKASAFKMSELFSNFDIENSIVEIETQAEDLESEDFCRLLSCAKPIDGFELLKKRAKELRV